jgi:hypothetical protein
MPSPEGYVRTHRDDLLLAFVGIARYASADQLHRLFFDGVSKKQTYRRLAKLCEPGGQPGEGPCLRRLQYRRRDGTGVPVWTLAPFGRSIASRQVPWLRPPAASDIGYRFLEHTLVLNEVLVRLVAMLRPGPMEPLSDLPFRWLCEDDEVLTYRVPHTQTGAWLRSVLKPDAVMTIPAQHRRLFIEAETGTQSIATAHPDRTGAVLSKLTRYRAFFMARSDDGYGTWYRASFPDDLEPRLVFIVHSDERRRKVQRAVTEKLGILAPSQFKVLVMTFAEAPVLLARYVREGVAEPAAPQRTRVVTFDEPMLERVRSGFNALAESLNTLRKIITDHNKAGGPQLQLPPVPIDAIKSLRSFVKQVVDAGLGPDAVPAPASPRPTGTGS